MDKLERTKQIIEETLSGDSIPCVFYSGGIDSLLLLYLLKDYCLPVITFTSDWTKEQKRLLEKIILDFNLTLYTYYPKNRYVVPNSDGLSLVDEYGFAGFDLPVIRDIEKGDKCLADLEGQRFDNFDFGFNTAFTGALKSDSHFIVGQTWFEEIKEQGKIKFVSPLYEWTKDEVEEAVKEFGLTEYVIESTGEIAACSLCLQGQKCPLGKIEIEYQGEEMLSAFRHKYYGSNTK